MGKKLLSPIPEKDLSKPKTNFIGSFLRAIGIDTTPEPAPTPTPITLNASQELVDQYNRMAGKPMYQAAPTATPTQAPVLGAMTSAEPYRPNITVPSKDGMTRLPENIAQALMNSLDPIGEATNAARVLIHPREQTRTQAELQRLGPSWNYGENARFQTDAPDPQSNGTIDRGLMRINSGTFDGMMANPYWRNRLHEKGIYSFEDMADPQKNVDTARILLERSNWDSETQSMRPNPNYMPWYAAPLDLRTR